MIRSLWSASSGMLAQQANMDSISNNLANVNTNGYKKNRVEFQDLLYSTLRKPGDLNMNGQVLPTGLQVGLGVKFASNDTMFTQGTLQQTESPLAMAIDGEGFFQIAKGQETFYTRDGSFRTDGLGRLVTADGYMVQPAITIPGNAQDITVSQDGTITCKIPDKSGQDEVRTLGKLKLYRFINPSGLSKQGENLFGVTGASGAALGDNVSSVKSGFLEASNVEVSEEMVKMIVAQRAYELSSKAVQASDEMLGIANNLRR